MTSTSLVRRDDEPEIDLTVIERVVAEGDLSRLHPEDRFDYYIQVCKSVKLNPATQPFKYIKLNGKLRLYATKDCGEQLRARYGISIVLDGGRQIGDVWIVKATATMPNGRRDEATGAVTLANARGDAMCNALMKAETKAKRRVTLSICGLGFVADESELDTMGNVEHVPMEEAQAQRQALPQSEIPTAPPSAPRQSEPRRSRPSPDVLHTDEEVEQLTGDPNLKDNGPEHTIQPQGRPPHVEDNDTLARRMAQAMDMARDIDMLAKLRDEAKTMNFSPREFDEIKQAYRARKGELT